MRTPRCYLDRFHSAAFRSDALPRGSLGQRILSDAVASAGGRKGPAPHVQASLRHRPREEELACQTWPA